MTLLLLQLEMRKKSEYNILKSETSPLQLFSETANETESWSVPTIGCGYISTFYARLIIKTKYILCKLFFIDST